MLFFIIIPLLIFGYVILVGNKLIKEDLSKLSLSLNKALKHEILEYQTIMSLIVHDLIIIGETDIKKSFLNIIKTYDLEALHNKNNVFKLDNIGIITIDNKLVTKFGIKKYNDRILQKILIKKDSNKLCFIVDQKEHKYQKNKIILAAGISNQYSEYKGYVKADWDLNFIESYINNKLQINEDQKFYFIITDNNQIIYSSYEDDKLEQLSQINFKKADYILSSDEFSEPFNINNIRYLKYIELGNSSSDIILGYDRVIFIKQIIKNYLLILIGYFVIIFTIKKTYDYTNDKNQKIIINQKVIIDKLVESIESKEVFISEISRDFRNSIEQIIDNIISAQEMLNEKSTIPSSWKINLLQQIMSNAQDLKNFKISSLDQNLNLIKLVEEIKSINYPLINSRYIDLDIKFYNIGDVKINGINLKQIINSLIADFIKITPKNTKISFEISIDNQNGNNQLVMIIYESSGFCSYCDYLEDQTNDSIMTLNMYKIKIMVEGVGGVILTKSIKYRKNACVIIMPINELSREKYQSNNILKFVNEK
jgi:hypothetical protein